MRRLRIETIFEKGILGNLEQTSGFTLDAASPRTSKHRVSAIASIKLRETSARSYPPAISRAAAAASRMWRSRTVSGFGIDNQSIPNYLVSEMPAEIHGSTQIDSAAAEQAGQLFFDFGKAEETNACLRFGIPPRRQCR
jgi:hypothetical protein